MNLRCSGRSPLYPNTSARVRSPPRVIKLSFFYLALAMCAVALTGCADCYDNDIPELPRAHFTAPQNTTSRVALLSSDLLSPTQEPNCEGEETTRRDTSMPDQNSDLALRIKLEYDKACYQQAEERTRERLNRLQSALAAKFKILQKEQKPPR